MRVATTLAILTHLIVMPFPTATPAPPGESGVDCRFFEGHPKCIGGAYGNERRRWLERAWFGPAIGGIRLGIETGEDRDGRRELWIVSEGVAGSRRPTALAGTLAVRRGSDRPATMIPIEAVVACSGCAEAPGPHRLERVMVIDADRLGLGPGTYTVRFESTEVAPHRVPDGKTIAPGLPGLATAWIAIRL